MQSQGTARFILFRLRGESFLLDIMGVRQILPLADVTAVPAGPAFLEGLINFRGTAVPLIDLAVRLFPGSLSPAGTRPVVLLVRTDIGEVGLKVDEIRRIVAVDVDSIQPTPAIVRGMVGRLFFGVVPSGEDLFLLMDLQSILSSDEKRELVSASRGNAAGVTGSDAPHP